MTESTRQSDAFQPIRVMIVDDHPLVRDGLKMLLKTTADMTLAAEAANGEEALRLCGEVTVDVVLMDLKMPGGGGVQATGAIRQMHPLVQVVAVTSFSEKALVEEALGAGAIGYVTKDAPPRTLAEAIRKAHAGQSTISERAAEKLNETDMGHDLTAREKEVLRLLTEGLSNREIGQRLVVQPATVSYHLGNILSKLEVANRTEAAIMAVRLGLVA